MVLNGISPMHGNNGFERDFKGNVLIVLHAMIMFLALFRMFVISKRFYVRFIKRFRMSVFHQVSSSFST